MGQWSLCVYTVGPISPCVPTGHMFEPVPDDLSSPRDSRKQLVDRIGGDCFKQRRGRGQSSGWAWLSSVWVELCPRQVTRERLSVRNKHAQQETAGEARATFERVLE